MNVLRLKETRQDLVKVIILATVSACVGLAINQLRDHPLPMIYSSKEGRLDLAVSQMQKVKASAPIVPGEASSQIIPDVLALEEFRKIVDTGKILILDARPEIFHRLGHIPGALSLPRDDFESGYEKLKDRLEVDRLQPLVIYCSSASCKDSGLISSALEKLGYTNISIFKGGWSAWQGAGLPEEVQ